MLPVKTASPPSVDRAFSILEEVAQSNRGLRLREIATKLGAPRSSTHSLLVALERRGYLQRNESTGRYCFGPKAFTLANDGLKGMALREISYPVLTGLMRQTGLTVHMAILDREHAVLIEQLVPLPEMAPMTWPGERLELHCTALGKALAAFQPEDHWERFAGKRALPQHNENTICSRKKFLDELAITRKRGYAFDDEEVDLGMRCLGVPVCGAAGTIAAISVCGNCAEVHAANAEKLVRSLTTAAAQIQRALGGASAAAT